MAAVSKAAWGETLGGSNPPSSAKRTTPAPRCWCRGRGSRLGAYLLALFAQPLQYDDPLTMYSAAEPHTSFVPFPAHFRFMALQKVHARHSLSRYDLAADGPYNSVVVLSPQLSLRAARRHSNALVVQGTERHLPTVDVGGSNPPERTESSKS